MSTSDQPDHPTPVGSAAEQEALDVEAERFAMRMKATCEHEHGQKVVTLRKDCRQCWVRYFKLHATTALSASYRQGLRRGAEELEGDIRMILRQKGTSCSAKVNQILVALRQEAGE